ncbi:MAG: site-specific DNA-methyltransferase [Pseudolabrys sp.]
MARKPRKRLDVARPVPQLAVDPAAWPANSVERWPLAKLVPYAANAKLHPVEQINLLTESIARWGWTIPVLVDEAGEIIAGHGRVMAAKRLGLAEAPVMVARGWSEAQKRSYRLADNRLAESGWDKELLALELNALAAMPDVEVPGLGFSQAELDRLLDPIDRPGATDPDETPEREAGGPAVTRPGDLWLLGGHRLLCGDCTRAADVATVLGADKPLLMVTDPPYGVDYDPDWRNHAEELGWDQGTSERAVGRVTNDHSADWREAWAHFPGDVAYVWHASWNTSLVQASLEAADFEIRYLIIWGKNRFVISRGHYHWQHEPCWYAVRNGRSGHWAGDRSQPTLWLIEHRKSETGHGTQKPVECMKRPILNNSREGDFVYEPFSGSGTTIIAAEQTGRRCLAIEIDPAYVDVAVRRWEAFTGLGAILAFGQTSFAETGAARQAAA